MSKINPVINDYYTEVLDDMINIILSSSPGRRQWTIDSIGRKDYSSTIRSTFPDWASFFYEKTPKNQRIKYLEDNAPLPHIHGYYNGNTKELLRILNNSKTGYMPRSDRLITTWEYCVYGFLEDREHNDYDLIYF